MSYSTMQRSLEIELISAEGLKVDRKPVKRKTFCVVKIDQKTRVCKLDESGGSCPTWKDKIEMEMPINGSVRFISIEVLSRTSGGAEKNVGLRDEYGDKSGILNVSIMVKPDGNNIKYSTPSPLVVATRDYAACSSQAAVNGQMWRPKTSSSMAVGAGYGGREVTGVPVWCTYQQSS
ncbi:BON1-associated protein 2 isoform X3 [Brassica napus]|uniref:BON1-associated protein 2 isoform X3 n=1 Tax=Brassica napus TaxID=3708 RepID=UPI0006AB67FE|nr:BON1-associated protein 2 isoform X3 [Brassica napus]